MKKRSVIAFAITAALAAPVAFGQDHGQSAAHANVHLQEVPPPPPVQSQGAVHAEAHSSVAVRTTFAELDADHDGRISIDEAGDDEALASGFVDLDVDDDGYVTDTEYRAGMKADMPQDADDGDDGDESDAD